MSAAATAAAARIAAPRDDVGVLLRQMEDAKARPLLLSASGGVSYASAPIGAMAYNAADLGAR